MSLRKLKQITISFVVLIPLIVSSALTHAGNGGGGGGAGPGAGVVGDDAGWTALLGTDTTDYGNDIAIDPIGNVVVVGDTFGSVNGDAS
ncbi:MAG: SBBP repeat-containing protein, partial [Pseudomonadota bacterium]